MIKAKLHTKWEAEYASGIDQSFRVISINIDGKRLVFINSRSYDNRATHYGETFEDYKLVEDREKRKSFLRKYRGEICISDELVEAISRSESHSVARQDSEPWMALIDGRLRRISNNKERFHESSCD